MAVPVPKGKQLSQPSSSIFVFMPVAALMRMLVLTFMPALVRVRMLALTPVPARARVRGTMAGAVFRLVLGGRGLLGPGSALGIWLGAVRVPGVVVHSVFGA
ncbi:MAG: hypothetical protein ACYDAG_06460 [Chloroflexota bacterium]